jgi:hypothetical protein
MTEIIAASIGPVEVFVLLLLGLYIWALVVSGMKGRWVWFVLGLFLFPFALVGALLSARPSSSWANKRG